MNVGRERRLFMPVVLAGSALTQALHLVSLVRWQPLTGWLAYFRTKQVAVPSRFSGRFDSLKFPAMPTCVPTGSVDAESCTRVTVVVVYNPRCPIAAIALLSVECCFDISIKLV